MKKYPTKKALALCLILLSTVVLALGQDKPYEITGTINNADGKLVYLNIRSKKLTDSSRVSNGGFNFKGQIDGVNFIALSLADASLLTVLEPGKLTITVADGKLSNAMVTGQQSAQDFKNCGELIDSYQNRLVEIRRLHQIATGKKDTVQMLALGRENDRINNEKITAVKQWVGLHRASLIGPAIVKTELKNLPIAELEQLLADMDTDVKKSKDGIDLAEFIRSKKALKIGQQAPLFTQANNTGNKVSLSDYKGKYLLIDFWASWCTPCRAENPHLLTVYEQFKDKNFMVLGVSLDEDKKAWLKAIKDDKLPWHQVSDLKGWRNAIAVLYAVGTVPQNYLIDPTGKVIAQNLHGDNLKVQLIKFLK